MNIEDFFNNVIKNCNSEFECIIKIISARGFLLEEKEDQYFLSDNSHKSDGDNLNSILSKENIGTCYNNKIIISDASKYRVLYNLFCFNENDNYECITFDKSWSYFRNRKHGYKVPTMELEPFIARYVKAISACGLCTSLSCDGNHINKNDMIINFHGEPYKFWHKWIIDNIITEYDLNWNTSGTKLHFSNDNKYDTYLKILEASNFLYENRIRLRELKDSATTFINRNAYKELNEAEIKQLIDVNAKDIWRKIK